MWTTFFKTNLGRLRLIGIIEGVSYLILLFIAMPLKYLAGQPEAVRLAGSVHGALFVLFGLYLLMTKMELRWSVRAAAVLVGLSMLPFGNFYADVKILKPAQG